MEAQPVTRAAPTPVRRFMADSGRPLRLIPFDLQFPTGTETQDLARLLAMGREFQARMAPGKPTLQPAPIADRLIARLTGGVTLMEPTPGPCRGPYRGSVPTEDG